MNGREKQQNKIELNLQKKVIIQSTIFQKRVKKNKHKYKHMVEK